MCLTRMFTSGHEGKETGHVYVKKGVHLDV